MFVSEPLLISMLRSKALPVKIIAYKTIILYATLFGEKLQTLY